MFREYSKPLKIMYIFGVGLVACSIVCLILKLFTNWVPDLLYFLVSGTCTTVGTILILFVNVRANMNRKQETDEDEPSTETPESKP